MTRSEELLAEILTDQAELLESHARALQAASADLLEHAQGIRRMVEILRAQDLADPQPGPKEKPCPYVH